MKANLRLLILFLTICCNTNIGFATIGTEKTLFVEMFGTNIFTVDEDGDAIYERQVDLINYANTHNYQVLILYDIWRVYDGNGVKIFPKNSLVTVPTASAITLEQKLADFIHDAKAGGIITKVAAVAAPYKNYPIQGPIPDNYNWFFDNINEFNFRSLLNYGYPDGVFDIIYTEQDYWAGDPDPVNDDNWVKYYKPGLEHMFNVVKPASTAAGYHDLLVGTYIGKVINNGVVDSDQDQIDFIDQHVDMLYVHIYLNV